MVTRDILEDGEIRVHTFLSIEAKKNHQRQIHSFGFYEQTWGCDHGGEMARFLGKDREFIYDIVAGGRNNLPGRHSGAVGL